MSSSLHYIQQSQLKFTNFISESDTPVCFCHSDRYSRTLVVFVCEGDGDSTESVVVSLSDKTVEMEFDGGEEPQEVEEYDDEESSTVVQVRDADFAIRDIRLSCDSLILAVQSPKDILLFHSSEFFCGSDESSSALKVYIFCSHI
jgi:hypothetical protein